MENTVSEDLGGKIKWGTAISVYPERDFLTPVHCTHPTFSSSARKIKIQ